MYKSKRYGRFRIPFHVIELFPGFVRTIMSQCIIVRAEALYFKGCIEYEAFSIKFEEVPEGCVMPEYEWVDSDDGIIAEKVNYER